MAFKLGSQNIIPGVMSIPTDASRGAALFSSGSSTYWAYPGEPNTIVGSGYRYRSIITHGYLAGGYKGSNPWRSVNKTWHATDITFYVGEQIDRAMAYGDGTFSDYNAYVHGTVNAFSGSSVHTSSYNLHTGVMRQRGDGSFGSTGIGNQGFGTTTDDPAGSGFTYGSAIGEGTTNPGVGGWNMSVARDYHGCASNQIGQTGYVYAGGSTVTDKMHFPTEIMYTTTSGPATGITASWGGENQAWIGIAGTNRYMTYSNDSFVAWSTNVAPDGMCKMLGSKHGYHYCGTGTNVSLPYIRFSDSNGTTLYTGNKTRALGEENMEMGQDWGYMLGQYDGQQNNHTVKYSYTTDVLTNMGAATRPKGHYGQSSGACSSAAATITAGYFL